MSNSKSTIDTFVKKTNNAIQYLMGLLNNQDDFFHLSYFNFFSSSLREVLGKSYENIDDFVFILENRGVLVSLNEKQKDIVKVNHNALADLIIECSKISRQNVFYQLPGLTKLTQHVDLPNDLKEFYQDYQSLNIKGYSFKQFTNNERN
jgi:hypothetical protein